MNVQTEEKGGDGYSQYDIRNNFSLVINEVRVEDNDNFFCEISEFETGDNFYNRTNVVVLGECNTEILKTVIKMQNSRYFRWSFFLQSATRMTFGPKNENRC